MNVSATEIQELHKKIEDHKLESYKASNEMAKSIGDSLNNLVTEMRVDRAIWKEGSKNFKGVIARLDQKMKKTEDKLEKVSDAVIALSTKQKTFVGIGGKIFPYLVAGLLALLSYMTTLSYFTK